MIEKIIASNKVWRDAMVRGVEQVDEIVGSTLGPKGTSVAIARKYRSPLITDDGVTAARFIMLKDPIEDIAAQILVEISMKTNETVGDGTTTAVVIASQIVRSAMKRLNTEVMGASNDPMALAEEIDRLRGIVVESLKKRSSETTEADLIDIASTSLKNRERGETLAAMVQAVGKDGYIAVEENWHTKYSVETEVISGMKFLGTYVTPYLMTNPARKEAVYEDMPVLLTNEHLESVKPLQNLLKELEATGKRKLCIMAEKFEKPVITLIANTMMAFNNGNPKALQVFAVKVPSLTSPEFADVAAFTGAMFFDKATGNSIQGASIPALGYVKKIVVDEDNVVLMGGAGNTEERIKTLQAQLDVEKDPMFKEKLKRRIASISAGIGVIRVGAATEQERTYLKYKIEDAQHATKAALEEGWIEGGGVVLKEIAEELGEDSILYEALRAPYLRIRSNAGDAFEHSPSAKDPVKVTRLALENACSAAARLITTTTAIADHRPTILEALEKQITGGNTGDFRQKENTDPNLGGYDD